MSASKQQAPKHGSEHQHPAELRERAVRMVQETMKETGERHGVVTRNAVQLGCVVQKLHRVRPRTSALPFVPVVLAACTDVAQIVKQRV